MRWIGIPIARVLLRDDDVLVWAFIGQLFLVSWCHRLQEGFIPGCRRLHHARTSFLFVPSLESRWRVVSDGVKALIVVA